MNKLLLYAKALFLPLVLLCFASNTWAQFTNSTVPPMTGNNGSAGSTFNLTVNSPILLQEIGQAFTSTNSSYEVWMSNTAISGPPNITTGNGWTLVQSGNISGTAINGNPTASQIVLNSPMLLTPGTYGFYVGGQSVRYTTHTTGNQTIFSDAFTTIETGPNTGYGGNVPNPTFHPRQFCGNVVYLPASSSPDNIAVNSLVTPGIYCAGDLDSVSVRVQNMGTNQVDSFMLVWDVNGAMDSSWYVMTLDTFLGTGSNDTILTLDTLTMPSGTTNITVWSKLPNGVADTDSSNDTITGNYIPALNGLYLIDPLGGGDFLSFTEAANALNNFGVCGPTIIEAVDTTYVEQIDLGNIVGMDAINTVTFRSQSGNRDNVVLTYSSVNSADNYVVKLTDNGNFSFEDMTIWNQGATYAYGVDLRGSDDITIDNCVIKSHYGTSSNGRAIYAYFSGTNPCNNFTLTNSVTDGGYYGLYYYGNFNNRAVGGRIENNQFLNTRYYGAYVYYQNDINFSNNYVESNTTNGFGYGMYFSQISEGNITGNFVKGSNNWPRSGMALFTASGDLSTWFNVSNNRFYIPHPSGDYGMYISNGLFTDISHNSIYLQGDAFGRGLYFANGQYNQAQNNNVQVAGAGQGIYLSGTPIYQMDYNNISAPNGNIGYFGGNQATLADWQMASGFDSNSVTVNMAYSDTSVLKVCTDSLYGIGTPVSHIMYDYEGDMRQNPPCIGADEFMPIALFGFTQSPVLCDGDTLEIVQNFFDTVVWNTTDTGSVYMVTNPQTITVSVYDVCGSASDTFNVTGQGYAMVNDVNLCEGTNATLSTGIANGTYQWSTGSTDSIIMVDSAQTVMVMVVDENGCSSADTVVITQSMNPSLPDTVQFCEGSSVTLDPGVPGTFMWSDGSTSATLTVSTPGTNCLTVTDQNCVNTVCSVVEEILNPVPSFDAESNFNTVIFTNTSTNTDGNTTYHWDFGDGATSSLENPIHLYPWTADTNVAVVVTLTVSNDCGDFVYQDTAYYGHISVGEINVADLVNVFPNPNSGIFNVKIDHSTSSDVTLEVVDIRGSVIKQMNLGSVNGQLVQEVNLDNAANGIYFVKVTLEEQTAIYKVAVE